MLQKEGDVCPMQKKKLRKRNLYLNRMIVLLGFREGDSGHILENIIFFELMRRGYDVAIGKIDNQEVDFIATKTDEKEYIQVTESMNAPETRERELAPLRKIRDSYEKIVIALECDLTQTQDGIKIIRALDFLLE